MGRSPGRDRSESDFRTRGRSRSTSRDRHHRRRRSRSRSRSRGRWRPSNSRSPDRHFRRSRSRSPSDGSWRRYNRSPSPDYRRSPSDPHHPPSWGHGPGGDVPPWHKQEYEDGPPPWRGRDEPPWRGRDEPPPWDLPPPGHHAGRPDAEGPWGRGPDMPSRAPLRLDGPDRRWDRSRSRGSDSDREWDAVNDRLRPQGGPPGWEMPTASVFIKGLPLDADESDIHGTFAQFPNIQSVKVLRDRISGQSKGMAFVDFASTADAQLMMESGARHNTYMGGQQLFMDYSTGPPSGSSGQAAGMPAQDWICDMCSAVNFARRLECYHCSTARPANPRRVTADLNEPSHILKVSGLELQTSEEVLYQVFSAATPNIVDLRVIKDKYTGAPRGFAFVELPSIAAAGSLMLACQGMLLPGQMTPLKICYAKAKEKLLGSASAATSSGPGNAPDEAVPAAVGADAAADELAVSGPLAWKPKEFNPAALSEGADGSTAAEQQEQQQGSSAAVPEAVGVDGPGSSSGMAAAPGSDAAATASAGPGPSSESAAASAAAAAAAGVDPATIQAMTQAGFEYQASSGYWWDPKSGYFYDANTQLYYHHSTNQWYQYDHDTGQYTAVGGGQQQQEQQPAQQQDQGTGGAGAAAPDSSAQPQQQQQRPLTAADKRRRAVIGSAPQYNPEGLLAAAALAEEREAEQRRIAAAKAARERQQQQQNKHVSKQPKLMAGKPGIGMLPGTIPADTSNPAVPAASQVVAEGNVQGVVYRSKWSQQRAAQQASK